MISSGFTVADSDGALEAAETELERAGFRVRRGMPAGAGPGGSASSSASTTRSATGWNS